MPLPMRIDAPCNERWADMKPVAGGRHCERCEKTVVDLTRATRRAAEEVVRAHRGRVCVRLAEDERGEPIFRAEPKRLPVLPMALAGLLAACAPDEEPPVPDPVAQVPDPQTMLPMTDSDGLDAASPGFGGSLATGMPMPDPPPSTPTSVEPPPVELGPGTDGTPTPEQIALTRRKRRHQQSLLTGPTIPRHTMGAIACPID